MRDIPYWDEFVFYWSLTSPFVTVMDISATDRNPEPGDNPLLFSTGSKGYFRCTQPQTVMHTTKPLLNQLGTTGICPHRSNQHTQDSNPGPFDQESQTLCVSPPSEDIYCDESNCNKPLQSSNIEATVVSGPSNNYLEPSVIGNYSRIPRRNIRPQSLFLK